eukprot:2798172-Rhodomonas_salina.3
MHKLSLEVPRVFYVNTRSKLDAAASSLKSGLTSLDRVLRVPRPGSFSSRLEGLGSCHRCDAGSKSCGVCGTEIGYGASKSCGVCGTEMGYGRSRLGEEAAVWQGLLQPARGLCPIPSVCVCVCAQR